MNRSRVPGTEASGVHGRERHADGEPAAVATGSPPLLAAHDVTFGYLSGRPVLAGADLRIAAGRRLAVLGPNGGGKTTLFRLLAGALRPTSGRILRDGDPISYSRRGLITLRQAVQVVLQDPDDQIFAASVFSDVSFGPLNLGLPKDEVVERVEDALRRLRISHLRSEPPHLLSFGQRKRVTIAGAVALRPAVLILDEPSAGLDPDGVEALLDTLGVLHEAATTVVLSTHDVDLACRWADDVAIVTDGQVRAGPADAMLADHDLLARSGLRPAWAPAVRELLTRAGLDSTGPGPRTANELLRILAEPDAPAGPPTRPASGT